MKRLLLVVGLSLTAIDAWAINPQFESFFVDVCGSSPTGTLAVRCAETPAGTGDLSTDSESSLNPNQTLSPADSGLAAARSASEQAQERADRALSGQQQEDAVQIGPFSLLLNVDAASAELDRSVDSDGERASDSDSWGVELGFDYRVNPKWVVGMFVDWESSQLEFDADIPGVLFTPQSNAGKSDADRVGVTAFGAVDTSANSFWSSASATSAQITRSRATPYSRLPVEPCRKPTCAPKPTSTAQTSSPACIGVICATGTPGSSDPTWVFSTHAAKSTAIASGT